LINNFFFLSLPSFASLFARNLNLSLYDSIYLSLSEDLDALLITADKKFFESVNDKNKKVIMLSDFLS
jgi:predicted nucleic acid-binding protein